MGTLYMVNPPKRRKRRTAKQKAATKKMLAARKRKLAGKRATSGKRKSTRKRRKGVTTMARRRGRKRATVKRRRRRSTAKRRSPITTLRRRSVYMTNPRRKRRRSRGRSRYRRNPAIFATVQQGMMDAGATLAGGAVARTVTGMLPLPKDGIAGVASGIAVAVGVGYAARKVVSADTARFLTAGAMQVPLKALITTFLPTAGAFLGDYDNIGAYALPSGDIGNYMNDGSMSGDQEYVEVSAYE